MGRRSREKRERRELQRVPVAERLQAIYDHVPNLECTGKCTGACGVIPLTRVEFDYVQSGLLLPRYDIVTPGGPADLLMVGDGGRCPLLVEGRCSVYPQRPFACRAYGVVEGLPCTFGCEPDVCLSKREVDILLKDVDKLNAETR